MTLRASRTWLICYDIRDPKRLARVYRYLVTEAVPVQYSVFVTRKSVEQLGEIRTELSRRIDPKCDDVRIYHVPDRPEVVAFGVQGLPHGIQLLASRQTGGSLPFTSAAKAHRVQSPGEDNCPSSG